MKEGNIMNKLMIMFLAGLMVTFAHADISINFVDANANTDDFIAEGFVEGAGDYATAGWINTVRAQTTGPNADLNAADLGGVGVYARRAHGTTVDFGQGANAGGSTAVLDGRVLRGFAQAQLNNATTAEQNAAHVELSNLNQAYSQGYDLVVYVSGDSGNLGASVTVNEGVIHTGYDRESGANFWYKTANTSSTFANGWRQGTVTGATAPGSTGAAYAVADYVVYEGLTADSLLLTVQGELGNKAGIGGFQVVAIPEPATVGFMAVASSGLLFLRKRFGMFS